jgi:hypothetical protein
MPVTVQWDNPEKTIIYARYERWSWGEYYKALAECTELSHTVDHQVDIICDLVDNLIPKGGTISHTMATLKQDNDRVGLIVLVTPNRFIQALTQMSERIVPGFKKKYRMTSTLESARDLIMKERQKRVAAGK